MGRPARLPVETRNSKNLRPSSGLRRADFEGQRAALAGHRLLAPLGARPDAVGAGALAAQQAAGEPRAVAAENADEVDMEGADGAVTLRRIREGTGVFVDVIVSVGCGHGHQSALRLHDPGRFGLALCLR